MSKIDCEVNIFDHEEIYSDCTIQILRSSLTGKTSIGWKVNPEIRKWHWRSADEQPPQLDECYIVLWRCKEPEVPHDRRTFFEICYIDENGRWNKEEDIPQAEDEGGAEILYWMPLPDKPEEILNA